MHRNFLRSKIHRARVTKADLNYEGSIAIDPVLIEAARFLPFERVEIYNVTNGNRLATYVVPGERDSGEICLNGAAARLVQPDDLVIICCYCDLNETEIQRHVARVVLVDQDNRVTEVIDHRVIGDKELAGDLN